MNSLLVNPILWAQFRLGGGWRTALTILLAFCGIIGLLAILLFRVDLDTTNASMALAWLVVLSILQGVLLLLIGTGAVRRVILRDFTTNMYDSHRLSPISGFSAMIGYVIGPNVVVLMLSIAGTLIGLAFCSINGYSHSKWIIGSFLQIVSAIMLWIFAATAALSTRGKANIAPLIVLVSILGGWMALLAVPGLTLLGFGALASFVSLTGIITTFQIDSAVVMALPQIIVAATVFWAGARKYRWPDLRAFAPWLGFLLLAEVAVICGLGVGVNPAKAMGAPREIIKLSTQINGTIFTLLLISLLPCSAMVQASAAWERRKLHEPEMAGRQPLHPIFGAILSALVIIGAVAFSLRYLAPKEHTLTIPIKQWTLVAAEITLGLSSWSMLLWPVYRRKNAAAVMGGLWLALLWVVPPLIDFSLNVALVTDAEAQITWLTGCSPIAAILSLWWDANVRLWPGLCLHGGIIIAMLYLLNTRFQQKTAQPGDRI